MSHAPAEADSWPLGKQKGAVPKLQLPCPLAPVLTAPPHLQPPARLREDLAEPVPLAHARALGLLGQGGAQALSRHRQSEHAGAPKCWAAC